MKTRLSQGCSGQFRGKLPMQGNVSPAERSFSMQIIRYLNGVPLSGAMPPLVLPFSLPRQHVPLPRPARSAILKAEERSPGKGKP